MDNVGRLMSGRGGATALSPPSAEEAFLAWLIALPPDADIAAAANIEIKRLDRSVPLPPGPKRLRALFEQAVAVAHEPRRFLQ